MDVVHINVKDNIMRKTYEYFHIDELREIILPLMKDAKHIKTIHHEKYLKEYLINYIKKRKEEKRDCDKSWYEILEEIKKL